MRLLQEAWTMGVRCFWRASLFPWSRSPSGVARTGMGGVLGETPPAGSLATIPLTWPTLPPPFTPRAFKLALGRLRKLDQAIARSRNVHGRTDPSNRRERLYTRRRRLHARIASMDSCQAALPQPERRVRPSAPGGLGPGRSRLPETVGEPGVIEQAQDCVPRPTGLAHSPAGVSPPGTCCRSTGGFRPPGRPGSTGPSVVADLVVGGSDSGSALWDISGESGTGSPPGV